MLDIFRYNIKIINLIIYLNEYEIKHIPKRTKDKLEEYIIFNTSCEETELRIMIGLLEILFENKYIISSKSLNILEKDIFYVFTMINKKEIVNRILNKIKSLILLHSLKTILIHKEIINLENQILDNKLDLNELMKIRDKLILLNSDDYSSLDKIIKNNLQKQILDNKICFDELNDKLEVLIYIHNSLNLNEAKKLQYKFNNESLKKEDIINMIKILDYTHSLEIHEKFLIDLRNKIIDKEITNQSELKNIISLLNHINSFNLEEKSLKDLERRVINGMITKQIEIDKIISLLDYIEPLEFDEQTLKYLENKIIHNRISNEKEIDDIQALLNYSNNLELSEKLSKDLKKKIINQKITSKKSIKDYITKSKTSPPIKLPPTTSQTGSYKEDYKIDKMYLK